jgi:hypothetical protein
MAEALEELLRRVAAGELTPEDAEPLVAQAAAVSVPPPPAAGTDATSPARTPDGRAVRIQVTEAGRTVVNLRVPMSWTGLTSLVPGLSGDQAARVSEALRTGERGRILDIRDEDGGGVIISTE